MPRNPQERAAVESGHAAVRLVDPDTRREYARLESPDLCVVRFLTFGREATRLVTTETYRSVHVWDLRAIRQQLVKMGLDGAQPPYPPASELDLTQPLRIELQRGDPARLQRDREETTRRTIDQRRRTMEANPNDATACNDLAWTYLTAPEALRDWKAALPAAERAVQLEPGALHRNTLGLAYYRAGRHREATESLQLNLKEQVDWALPYDLYFLAMCHHQLGESARARELHDLAVRWSSAHREALDPYAVELAAIQDEAAELLGVKDKKH
jgi:tetratricopeptide (TPR) repeat protein